MWLLLMAFIEDVEVVVPCVRLQHKMIRKSFATRCTSQKPTVQVRNTLHVAPSLNPKS